MLNKIFLTTLTLLILSATASATDINISLQQQPNYSFKLAIFLTNDQNQGTDANKLEALIGNRLYTKDQFTSQRIGEFELQLTSQQVLDAETITVIADKNQATWQLQVTQTEKIEPMVIGLQPTTPTQTPPENLEENIWQGQILDHNIEISVWMAIAATITAGIAICWARGWD